MQRKAKAKARRERESLSPPPHLPQPEPINDPDGMLVQALAVQQVLHGMDPAGPLPGRTGHTQGSGLLSRGRHRGPTLAAVRGET